MRTMLGWTLNGPLTPTLSTASEAVCNFVHTTEKHEIALESQVENFWKRDTEFAPAKSEAQMSVEDISVVDIWNKSIVRVEGHYEKSIPFKPDVDTLPSNRKMAEG